MASSDLIVGMAREHVREAACSFPTAYARTFTLKELVRRGRRGRRARGDDEPFESGSPASTTAATPLMHLGASPDDDVADPIGRRSRRLRTGCR